MTADLDPVALLAAYDTHLRGFLPDPLPAGAVVETDGPVFRLTEPGQAGFVGYRDLGGLDGPDLDALIARQRDHFAALGRPVEWKLHGHDLPADLPDRLVAAGFEPEEQETVVIGLAAPLAALPPLDDPAVRLCEVDQRSDLDRIAAMESEVWDEDRSWLPIGLAGELAANPDALTIVVAEVDGRVVSAGWIRYVTGTPFGTLWGGSTLAEYRGRGIYTALVAHRARLAVARGFTMLQVDASDDSRPILQRRGFVPVTTTTPYVYSPR